MHTLACPLMDKGMEEFLRHFENLRTGGSIFEGFLIEFHLAYKKLVGR